MPKRKFPEHIVATDGGEVYNYVVKKVKIQSQYPGHLRYRGRESGELYEWMTAGAIVEVRAGDVAELLAKKFKTGSCCGQSSDGNKPFRLVE